MAKFVSCYGNAISFNCKNMISVILYTFTEISHGTNNKTYTIFKTSTNTYFMIRTTPTPENRFIDQGNSDTKKINSGAF